MTRPVTHIDQVDHLPRWRRPEALLLLASGTLWFGFSLYMVTINNYAVEMVDFDGADTGWRESVREIPGFLSFLVIFLIRFMREQTLAMVALMLLGVATALTSAIPSFWGLLFMIYLASMGFHYFEAVNQSLQLQWFDKESAPRKLGWIVAAGAVGSLIALASCSARP